MGDPGLPKLRTFGLTLTIYCNPSMQKCDNTINQITFNPQYWKCILCTILLGI